MGFFLWVVETQLPLKNVEIGRHLGQGTTESLATLWPMSQYAQLTFPYDVVQELLSGQRIAGKQCRLVVIGLGRQIGIARGHIELVTILGQTLVSEEA